MRRERVPCASRLAPGTSRLAPRARMPRRRDVLKRESEQNRLMQRGSTKIIVFTVIAAAAIFAL